MKNKKYIWGAGAITAVSAITVASALSIGKGEIKIEDSDKYVVNDSKVNDAEDLLGTDAKHDETNIYYTHAIYPYTYMLKHAILSRNKTIFCPQVNTAETFQNIFNKKEFLAFKGVQGLSAEVWDMGAFYHSSFPSKLLSYILKHPNEKINVFTNIFWKLTLHSFVNVQNQFSKFKNVRFVFVEDGSNNYVGYKNNYGNDSFLDRNKKSIFLINEWDEVLHNKEEKFYKNSKAKEISDRLFSERIKLPDGTTPRKYGYYNKISGFDYTEGLRVLKEVSKNGKQSLLILGSYADKNYAAAELEFVKWVYSKYSKKYNVFYKGHPGHNIYAANIFSKINNGESNAVLQKVHILNTFVPSEEYTNHHIDLGMKFRSFIASGDTGALKDIDKNGYNKITDILGEWHYDQNNPKFAEGDVKPWS